MTLNDVLTILGLKDLGYSEMSWVIIGILGQLIFFSRWVVQWIASERNSKSVIPTPFWWFSLCGGLITFAYAYHISSFPFMLAQFTGIIIYIRNIYLITKAKKNHE